MTPTQEQIRKLSDKELKVQLIIVKSLLKRVQRRDQWLTEEMERRGKSE